MEPRKIIKKIVLTRLNTIINVKGTQKTLGEAIIDGTANIEQVKHLNYDSERGFPSNINRSTSPLEKEYSSVQAMLEFLEVLSPYLSDLRLYDFVDKLCAEEFKVEQPNTVMRGNRMAKIALEFENKRHGGGITQVFLSHMNIYAVQALAKNANPINDFNNMVKLIGNLPPCYDEAKAFAGIEKPLNDKPRLSIDDYHKLIAENLVSYPVEVEKKSSVTAKKLFSGKLLEFINNEKSTYDRRSNIKDLKHKLKDINTQLEKNPHSTELLKKKESYSAMLAKLMVADLSDEEDQKPQVRQRSATK